MIPYKFPEELQYAKYFANKLGDSRAYELLSSGVIASDTDAEHLSKFFWRMVDQSIEDEENGLDPVLVESNEFWNEKLLYSISGYLEKLGYDNVWEKVSDSQ